MSSLECACIRKLWELIFVNLSKTKTKTVYWNIKTKLMSSTQCKDTKSYENVNEHTTGRNILNRELSYITRKCRFNKTTNKFSLYF